MTAVDTPLLLSLDETTQRSGQQVITRLRTAEVPVYKMVCRFQ